MGVSQERISRAYQCHSWAKILSVEACSSEHLYFSLYDKMLISYKVDKSHMGGVGGVKCGQALVMVQQARL